MKVKLSITIQINLINYNFNKFYNNNYKISNFYFNNSLRLNKIFNNNNNNCYFNITKKFNLLKNFELYNIY
jgi:hypothetical protein